MARFNKLDVPHQWKDEFTKYPHGYTIFEALCRWVKQVDNMVDNINNWNTYLDNFVESFDIKLQAEVQSTIERWQSEGLLDGIIESALNTELDNVKMQLAESTQQINNLEEQKAEKTEVNATNLRIDNLVIPISPENANIEVTDAHNSIVKNKNFLSLKDRLEETEQDVVDINNKINSSIVNMVLNGNFNNDSIWQTSNATKTIYGSVGTFLASAKAGRIYQSIDFIKGHMYYIRLRFKSDSTLVAGMRAGAMISGLNHSGSGEYETKSTIITAPSTDIVSLGVYDNRESGWTNVEVDYIVCIDLTEGFGQNKEPDIEFMDKFLSGFPEEYFEGTAKLNDTQLAILKTLTNNNQELSVRSGLNLINKFAILKNKTVDENTGNIIDNANFNVVNEFIPCMPNTNYTGYAIKVLAYYTKNKRYISRQVVDNSYDANTFTTPSNAYYIMPVVSSTERSQLNEGDTLLPFEPYKININNVLIQPNEKTHLKTIYTIDGKLDDVYSAPTIPYYAGLRTSLASDIIALYDDLMASYSDYITKSILGQSVNGQNIYKYDLKPPKVFNDNSNIYGAVKQSPKIILLGGTHGNEKAGTYCLYQSIKEICEGWNTNELLETLRWNVHFVVIPVLNPDGYDADIRVNANGVNIERNFPVSWTLNDIGDDYSGTAPLTEPETQILKGVLDENRDAIAYISYHNYAYPTVPTKEFLTWGVCGTKHKINLYSNFALRMARKWKKEHSWLPQDDITILSDIADHTISTIGNSVAYSASIGIQSMIYEIPANIPSAGELGTEFSSLVLTLGTEGFINWLLMSLKHDIEFHNIYYKQ